MAQPVIPGTSGSPQRWCPSTMPKNLIAGVILAGDWVQVSVVWRGGTSPPAPSTGPGFFLFHVLVKPNADDTVANKPDQPTVYGGSASNTTSVYRVDPGLTFQVPFTSQLQIVAGSDAPADCLVDVILKRGFAARFAPQLAQGPYGSGCAIPAGPHVWAPPITGSPQEVHCTYFGVPTDTPIEFPSGAVAMTVVDDSGTAGNPVLLTATAFGLSLPFNLASGIRQSVSAQAQGGGQSGSTPATWQHPGGARPPPGLNTVVMFQSFGP